MTKKDVQEIEGELGYPLTFETDCQECGEYFEVQDLIPKKVLKKMMKDETDDPVFEWIGDQPPMTCPKCKAEEGDE